MTLPAGLTPRLLTKDQLADYLGEIPVAEVTRQGVGRVMIGTHARYDLRAVNAWLDRLSGLIPNSADAAPPADDFDDPEAALARFTARS